MLIIAIINITIAILNLSSYPPPPDHLIMIKSHLTILLASTLFNLVGEDISAVGRLARFRVLCIIINLQIFRIFARLSISKLYVFSVKSLVKCVIDVRQKL